LAAPFPLVAFFWLHLFDSPKTGVLVFALLAVALWETFRPRRALSAPTGRRWAHNAILGLLVNYPAHWIYPATAVAVAAAVSTNGYGLLNRAMLPFWLRCVASFLLLDLLRYGQHRLYHAIPLLWRIHRVHHSDPEVDCSSGFLFHPGELLLTQGSYLAVVAILAPPPSAVAALELMVLAQNVFAHGNVALPQPIDALLRRVWITPDMHRIHHSDEIKEQNTNFGTVFPWWDLVFRTYLRDPAAGQQKMRIGLRELQGQRSLNVLRMLALPFRNRL
jgi:sterol desaturase/sphingolipid hydroxylase (fatty acid hydroxylase superfamily)